MNLATLQADLAALNQKVAQFEALASLQFPITVSLPPLGIGEKFAGVIISADGTRREGYILLPGEFKGSYDACVRWAESINGMVPDRVESALFHATLKGEFKPEGYWTREQHAGIPDYAWMQYFGDGNQFYGRKSSIYLARAVRKFTI